MHTIHTRKPAATWVGGLAADDYGHERSPPAAGPAARHDVRPDHLAATSWPSWSASTPGAGSWRSICPGTGSRPTSRRMNLMRSAGQLNRVVQEAGLAAPVIVGHSAGALAATMYADAAPHPWRRQRRPAPRCRPVRQVRAVARRPASRARVPGCVADVLRQLPHRAAPSPTRRSWCGPPAGPASRSSWATGTSCSSSPSPRSPAW